MHACNRDTLCRAVALEVFDVVGVVCHFMIFVTGEGFAFLHIGYDGHIHVWHVLTSSYVVRRVEISESLNSDDFATAAFLLNDIFDVDVNGVTCECFLVMLQELGQPSLVEFDTLLNSGFVSAIIWDF